MTWKYHGHNSKYPTVLPDLGHARLLQEILIFLLDSFLHQIPWSKREILNILNEILDVNYFEVVYSLRSTKTATQTATNTNSILALQ